MPPRSLSASTKLTLAYAGLAAADTFLAGSSNRWAHRARVLTKPLLMPTLAASLLRDPKAGDSPLRTSTLAAQAFGWGGDLALMRSGTKAFATGAGSFGAGHVAYVTGFHRHGNPTVPIQHSTAMKVGTGLLAAGGPAMALGAFRQEKVLGPAVLGYSALLSAMLAHAAHLDPALPPRARRLTVAGATLFTASDTLLATRKFWWTRSPERLESVVMATYTAGQLLLSKGAAAAGA